MHLASEGVATGDSVRPFLARVTIGSKNRRDVLAEFEAKTLIDAEDSAAAWLEEYSARVELGSDRLRAPAIMRARWQRLHGNMPALPEPGQAYCRALEMTALEPEENTDARNCAASADKRAGRYPTKAKIITTVAAARAAGVDVAGLRVWPDGSIAVFDHRLGGGKPQGGDTPESAYDEWSQCKRQKAK